MGGGREKRRNESSVALKLQSSGDEMEAVKMWTGYTSFWKENVSKDPCRNYHFVSLKKRFHPEVGS